MQSNPDKPSLPSDSGENELQSVSISYAAEHTQRMRMSGVGLFASGFTGLISGPAAFFLAIITGEFGALMALLLPLCFGIILGRRVHKFSHIVIHSALAGVAATVPLMIWLLLQSDRSSSLEVYLSIMYPIIAGVGYAVLLLLTAGAYRAVQNGFAPRSS